MWDFIDPKVKFDYDGSSYISFDVQSEIFRMYT